MRSTPAASFEVTLWAPVSVWLIVPESSSWARMLPEPRMPRVARFVRMRNFSRSRATMSPVKVRMVPRTRARMASPEPAFASSNS